MPRKSTKTATQATETLSVMVDTSAKPSSAQIVNKHTSEGKPEQIPAKGKRTGRPSSFTQQIADIICSRIAEGESLREICKDDNMPDRVTIYRWLQADSDFCNHYTRAREDQADTLADEIIAIADEQPEIIAVIDKKTGAIIEHKLDHAFLQWQKNRMDARKWTAMKLKPKKYGDRLVHAGDSENPLEIQNDAMTILAAAVKNLELKRQTANEE
jgi:hypothetical protein